MALVAPFAHVSQAFVNTSAEPFSTSFSTVADPFSTSFTTAEVPFGSYLRAGSSANTSRTGFCAPLLIGFFFGCQDSGTWVSVLGNRHQEPSRFFRACLVAATFGGNSGAPVGSL